jgi:hypothetical protein
LLPQRDLIGFRRDRREAVFIFALNHYVISQRCSKPGLIRSSADYAQYFLDRRR